MRLSTRLRHAGGGMFGDQTATIDLGMQEGNAKLKPIP
jgi:hypothetical protein